MNEDSVSTLQLLQVPPHVCLLQVHEAPSWGAKVANRQTLGISILSNLILNVSIVADSLQYKSQYL